MCDIISLHINRRLYVSTVIISIDRISYCACMERESYYVEKDREPAANLGLVNIQFWPRCNLV